MFRTLFILFFLVISQLVYADECRDQYEWGIQRFFFCTVGEIIEPEETQRQPTPLQKQAKPSIKDIMNDYYGEQTEADVCLDGSCRANGPRISQALSPIPTGENLARGSLRLLSSLYQSCSGVGEPLTAFENNSAHFTRYKCTGAGDQGGACSFEGQWIRRVHSPESGQRLVSEHPYGQVPNQCRSFDAELYGTPKLFADGGTPGVYEVNGRTVLDPFHCGGAVKRGCGIHNDSAPMAGIDCFEFVALAATSACLKLHADQKVVKGPSGFMQVKFGSRSPKYLFTGLGAQLGEGKIAGSCIGAPQVSLGKENALRDPFFPLKSGDTIVDSGARHSAVVTKLGTDPLGIQKALKSSDPSSCDKINAGDFNFSLSQSTGAFASSGPVHVAAQAYDASRFIRSCVSSVEDGLSRYGSIYYEVGLNSDPSAACPPGHPNLEECFEVQFVGGPQANTSYECSRIVQTRDRQNRSRSGISGSILRPPLSNFLTYAKKLCARIKSGAPGSASTSDIFSSGMGRGAGMGIYRHKGTPECSYPPGECPGVRGDQCGLECFPRSGGVGV